MGEVCWRFTSGRFVFVRCCLCFACVPFGFQLFGCSGHMIDRLSSCRGDPQREPNIGGPKHAGVNDCSQISVPFSSLHAA